MPRFFVDKTAFFDTVDTGAEKTANVTEKFARIVGDDAFHIARSLRMAVGEHVTICDTESTDYECELEKITDNNVPGEEKNLPVRKKSIAVVIGSEGGFSEKEAEKAKATGLIPVGLGKRILRTETAAVFSLACIAYSFDM